VDENANMEGHPSVVSINSFPETRVLQIGQFRIGVVHGHQIIPWGSKEAVERMRRKLQVDILVTGHTHQSAVVVDEENGFYHINPVRSLGKQLSCQIQIPLLSFVVCATTQSYRYRDRLQGHTHRSQKKLFHRLFYSRSNRQKWFATYTN
jgi:Calcineurin-like phosphoesterase superfamily domain